MALREALRAELARAARPPYAAPVAVVTNGLIVLAVWFLLPRGWFFRFTGTAAFPVALAGWMYADATATNVLAETPDTSVGALADPARLRDVLRARCLVLWLLVAPVCAVVTVAIDAGGHHWLVAVTTLLVVAVVPLGVLGLTGWVGVRYPYRQRPLRWRWSHRRPWSTTLRWLTLAGVPYGLVPLTTGVVMGPALLLWTVTGRGHDPREVGDGWFAVGAVLAVLASVAAWRIGHRVVVASAVRRRAALTEYLTDPSRG